MSVVSVEWAVEDPGAVSAARGVVDLRKQANMMDPSQYKRLCYRCGKNPGTNGMGAPVCEDCRANPICTGCGGPRDKDYSRCYACRKEAGRIRQVRVKTCLTCGTEFRSKAAPNYCGSCLHKAAKHPCRQCGVPCDKRAALCLKCNGQRRGEDNPNWRGGVAKPNGLTGYVREMAPDHPRATQNGYVAQHTLVMEHHLGRYLLPGENVHHKNGVRHDNRIDNLELWVVSQPAGQRAADLLAWAHEIIDRYDPVKAVL